MSIDAMKLALEALEEINKLSIGENAICLPAEIDGAMDALRERLARPNEFEPDWDQIEALQESLREHMAEIQRLRQWRGLDLFDKTLLRTTHASLKPVYYDRVHDRSVCAEVVTDWDNFFAAIEAKLKEKNND
jgi:hypothetical protein